jgi:hypothetical protein
VGASDDAGSEGGDEDDEVALHCAGCKGIWVLRGLIENT